MGTEASSINQGQRDNRTGAVINWARRRARDLAPFITLVILIIFFSIASNSFFNYINFIYF